MTDRLAARFLGTGVSYAAGMAAMREAMARVDEDGPVLLLLEHAPVVTVTRAGGTAHLTSSPEALAEDGIALEETDRGGDVTFHGPGQLVGYPVVRLARDNLRARLVEYVRALEQGLIDAAAALGVRGARREEGATGVWVGEGPGAAKLVAIGVGVGRGVTRHGFAFNVTTDLERFTRHIVPCGLVGRPVTSLQRLLPTTPPDEQVRAVVAEHVGRALAAFLSSQPSSTSVSSFSHCPGASHA